MDWSPAFNTFPTVLTVRRPTDGSYKYATTGWPGMYCAFTALNEHGAYLDVHDGTSMGGSVTYIERPSSLNVISDLLCEAASFSGCYSPQRARDQHLDDPDARRRDDWRCHGTLLAGRKPAPQETAIR